MTDQLINKPIHPHETEEYVLLKRAVDALRGLPVDAMEDTTMLDLEWDIDCYLARVASKAAGN